MPAKDRGVDPADIEDLVALEVQVIMNGKGAAKPEPYRSRAGEEELALFKQIVDKMAVDLNLSVFHDKATRRESKP